MRLLKIFIQDMPRFKGNIDIDFITKQRVAEDDQEKLFNTFSNNYTSIYTNQAISFIGLNASGKTTILKAISFVINLLNNEALNNIKSKEILNDFSKYLPKFKKIIPHDYKKMLQKISEMEGKGLSAEQAQIEAFYEIKRG